MPAHPDPAAIAGKGTAMPKWPVLMQETDSDWESIFELDDVHPSGDHRYVAWTILLLLTGAIVWACIADINVIAAAPGKLVPEGKVKTLQTTENAIVRAVHVKEGQRVKAGEILVALDPTINGAEHRVINEKLILFRLELERLNAELANRNAAFDVPGASSEEILLQEAMLASQRNAYAAKWAEANSTRHHRLMLETGAKATLKKLEASSQTAREREEKVRPYVGVAIPYFEYLKLKDNASNLESELLSQKSAVDAAREERSAAEYRLRLLEADHRNTLMAQIHEKKALITTLTGDQVKTGQLLAQKELRSPVDGQVQNLSVSTVGSAVMPGQTIATIVPDNTPLLIDAALSNEDIGYVRVGQRVDIKIDTFPFQKYGTLPGVVAWISPDAEPRSPANIDPTENQKSGEASSVPSKGGLMYRIRIKPDRTTLPGYGTSHLIATGMTVQAEIITDRRRVIEFFLSPIVKHLDEGMKNR